jgi:hypothetical protein
MSNRAFQRHGPDSSLPGLQSLPVPDKRNQDGSSPTGSSSDLVHLSHDGSRQASPFEQLSHPDSFAANKRAGKGKDIDDDDESDFDPWDDDIEGASGVNDPDMPSDHRVGRSSQNLPLLAGDKQGDYEERDVSTHTRHSRFREQDSDQIAKQATKKRYTYAACFLVVSLISFAVQTETAVYIQHNLGWKKPYCMLYESPFVYARNTLTNTFLLAISHTAHGQSYGQHNSSSFASKNLNSHGRNSGAAMFPSSARQRK